MVSSVAVNTTACVAVSSTLPIRIIGRIPMGAVREVDASPKLTISTRLPGTLSAVAAASALAATSGMAASKPMQMRLSAN